MVNNGSDYWMGWKVSCLDVRKAEAARVILLVWHNKKPGHRPGVLVRNQNLIRPADQGGAVQSGEQAKCCISDIADWVQNVRNFLGQIIQFLKWITWRGRNKSVAQCEKAWGPNQTPQKKKKGRTRELLWIKWTLSSKYNVLRIWPGGSGARL